VPPLLIEFVELAILDEQQARRKNASVETEEEYSRIQQPRLETNNELDHESTDSQTIT
jgi:hypothetical protein